MPLTVVSGPSRTEDPNRGARKQTMQSNLSPLHSLPEWLPDAVRLYLDHTEEGVSLRALARRDGRHASTVMRLVRRYENRRRDPFLGEGAWRAAARGGGGVRRVVRLGRGTEPRGDDFLGEGALAALRRGAVGAALDPVRKDSPM